MRKELGGILILFLVVLTTVSLLTFSPADPSINHARGPGDIHNFFGVLGAYTAGLLLSGFGLGAFWIPFLLFLAGMRVLGGRPAKTILPIALGGLLLIIATGCLFALRQDIYSLMGSRFPAGGITGIPLKDLLVSYAGPAGGAFIAFLLFLTGLIIATGFSPVRFGRRCYALGRRLYDALRTRYIIRRERKLKAEKRAEVQKKQAQKPEREIVIKAPAPVTAVPPVPAPKQKEFDFMSPSGPFDLPSVKFLTDPDKRPASMDDDSLHMQAKLLEKKLEDFGISGEVTEISPGPVVTTFEYRPAPGVKINRIVNLSDDLALALRAISIRIVAPIPGKSVIGIEIPNAEREVVRIKEIIVSQSFEKSKSRLTLCLGKDIVGEPVAVEMDKMPHLLVAGSTGSGKSVALNTMICSLLYKARPDEVKLLMIDPKRIELSLYDGIPHLIAPVVTNMKKATNALNWAVREMEERYEKLASKQVRNIAQYNKKIEKESDHPDDEKLPYIVIIIDEFADLMAVASRDVETALARLAQMARAAGVHLILATQRPSVNVITGVIKANFPTRISFQVSSKIDSRTILDTNGAESLLGSGDMLYLPPGTGKLQRIHGAFISEDEVNRIIEFLKKQKEPEFDESVTLAPPAAEEADGDLEFDDRYDEAVALVSRTRQASISMIQRHLRIGYNRAARIIEVMEQQGVVGPSDGVKQREVLISNLEDMDGGK
ncbi:DNA translocase FtsK [Desulfosudis oleivorans]|uniref:Cell divisionFtsK/SpoIIIE n=1 Tax=Desulfosudis oleivorans (strain DSM 6200 / JCM 39069 / Hxd3) TaxID=96561 RepID=A8ZWQ8_DESOH|nr:DNA translocase FtsK [Desulfosudis oleivorans]ABW68389.1 cell divisionFtsK/SpoIIIE [Desulfosudis oleivorans Hxd3]